MPYLTKRRYTAPFLSAAILIDRNYNTSSKGLQRTPRRDIQYRVHFYIHLTFSNAVLFKWHLIKRKTFSISIMTRLLTAVRIQIISVLTHANYASRIQTTRVQQSTGSIFMYFFKFISLLSYTLHNIRLLLHWGCHSIKTNNKNEYIDDEDMMLGCMTVGYGNSSVKSKNTKRLVLLGV